MANVASHRFLTHYTNKQGYESIMQSGKIRPSTVAGVKNTHYGQGVYFTPLDNSEIGIFGPYDFIRRVFNDVTEYAVDRVQYFITVSVQPEWRAQVAREVRTMGPIDDIWLVPSPDELDISNHIMFHGKTSIGYAVDEMRNKETAARDYAYQLNEQVRADRLKQPEAPYREPRRAEYVFIDGRTVKRPEGWDEDYFYCGITPGGQ